MSVLSSFSENSTSFSNENSADSSHSSNFAKNWNKTYQGTIQFIKETEVEIKRNQIQRQNTEMEATLLNREIELQSEITEVTSDVSGLRLKVSQLEKELSSIKEDKNSIILSIRKSLAEQLSKFQPVFTDSEKTIEKLKSAIAAQRENHERNKMMYGLSKNEKEKTLDAEISQLNAELDKIRNVSAQDVERRGFDITNAQNTYELLNNEIFSLQSEFNDLNDQRMEVQRNLNTLRENLIIVEEESIYLHNQLVKNSNLRAKMKGILDRARFQRWNEKTAHFQTV